MKLTDRLRGPLFHTAAFRMALWQAGLFALLASILLGIVWQQINRYTEGELRDQVASEMLSLRTADLDGKLQLQLRQQMAGHAGGSAYYLLSDASGHLIIGNLHYRPRAVGWHVVPLQDAIGKDRGDADQVHLLVTRLTDGRWLVLGRDNRSVIELGEVLTHAFIELGLFAITLVLLSGSLVSWRYLHRVDALGVSAERILEGERELPLNGSGRGDEIDRLATRFNRMLQRMRVLMEGMRQVSNNIAHDLRTPLSMMRQRLETSLLEAQGKTVPASVVHQTIADVDSIQATFRALMRIADVEARQRRSGFEQVDLSALLEHVAETYRPVAEDSDHLFHTEIAGGVHMHGDRALLAQMLANLIENALHHTPPGSSIRVTLRNHQGIWTGRIVDNGAGIPEQARDDVLKRFVRMDSSRSAPGAGLGLSLVAAVCDLHGIKLVLGDARPGLIVDLRFQRPDLHRIEH